MAKDEKAAAAAAKKEEKAAKRAKRKRNMSALWQAFNMQRKRDKKLIPLMLLALVVPAVALFLIGLLFHGQWFMLAIGIGLGVVAAMWVFSRRIESTMFDEAAGSPGAAGWVLENMRNTIGVIWFTKTAVAANTHMDVVHRVVGVPGVVLVAEGKRHRVKPLLEQQKRRIHRLADAVPIYEVFVGDGDDEVQLKNLQRHMLKLPRNYRKNDVYPINARIEAMDSRTGGAGNPGLPHGPLPKQASMSGMNRRARRAAERSKRG